MCQEQQNKLFIAFCIFVSKKKKKNTSTKISIFLSSPWSHKSATKMKSTSFYSFSDLMSSSLRSGLSGCIADKEFFNLTSLLYATWWLTLKSSKELNRCKVGIQQKITTETYTGKNYCN